MGGTDMSQKIWLTEDYIVDFHFYNFCFIFRKKKFLIPQKYFIKMNPLDNSSIQKVSKTINNLN